MSRKTSTAIADGLGRCAERMNCLSDCLALGMTTTQGWWQPSPSMIGTTLAPEGRSTRGDPPAAPAALGTTLTAATSSRATGSETPPDPPHPMRAPLCRFLSSLMAAPVMASLHSPLLPERSVRTGPDGAATVRSLSRYRGRDSLPNACWWACAVRQAASFDGLERGDVHRSDGRRLCRREPRRLVDSAITSPPAHDAVSHPLPLPLG
jgi:hypothetical protein